MASSAKTMYVHADKHTKSINSKHFLNSYEMQSEYYKKKRINNKGNKKRRRYENAKSIFARKTLKIKSKQHQHTTQRNGETATNTNGRQENRCNNNGNNARKEYVASSKGKSKNMHKKTKTNKLKRRAMKTNTITTKAKRAHFPLQTQAAVSPAMTTATAAERYARTNSNNANPLAQKSNKRANNKTTHCRATPRTTCCAVSFPALHIRVCVSPCNWKQHPTAPHASHLTPSHAPQARCWPHSSNGTLALCHAHPHVWVAFVVPRTVACCYCWSALMLVLHGVAEF